MLTMLSYEGSGKEKNTIVQCGRHVDVGTGYHRLRRKRASVHDHRQHAPYETKWSKTRHMWRSRDRVDGDGVIIPGRDDSATFIAETDLDVQPSAANPNVLAPSPMRDEISEAKRLPPLPECYRMLSPLPSLRNDRSPRITTYPALVSSTFRCPVTSRLVGVTQGHRLVKQ
jgi:hypothetical protein